MDRSLAQVMQMLTRPGAPAVGIEQECLMKAAQSEAEAARCADIYARDNLFQAAEGWRWLSEKAAKKRLALQP